MEILPLRSQLTFDVAFHAPHRDLGRWLAVPIRREPPPTLPTGKVRIPA